MYCRTHPLLCFDFRDWDILQKVTHQKSVLERRVLDELLLKCNWGTVSELGSITDKRNRVGKSRG